MKTFVKKLICFLLIVAAIDIGYGFAVGHYRRNVKAGMTRLDNIAAYETKADVLVFGSSRARRHYDTRIIRDSLGMEAFNCGYNSMGIEFFYPRLLQILRRYTPRMIIYDVTPLFDLMGSDSRKANLKRLKPFYLDPIAREAIRKVDPAEWIKSLSATYRYHGELEEYRKDQTNKEKFYNGYAPLVGTLKIDFKPHDKMKEDPEKLKLMERFIDECQRRGIELVFVVSPYFSNDMGDQCGALRRMVSGGKALLLDHFNDSLYMKDSTLYWDASHLNDKGAGMFTRTIVNEIKRSKS